MDHRDGPLLRTVATLGLLFALSVLACSDRHAGDQSQAPDAGASGDAASEPPPAGGGPAPDPILIAGSGAVVEDAGVPPLEGTQLEIYGLAHDDDGTFVATGGETVDGNSIDSSGVIYASEDGRSWTKVASGLLTVPWDVSYGNGRFVAVGSWIKNGVGPATKRSEAYVSEDGRTWTTARYAFTSSTDGLSWTPLAMRGPDMPRITVIEDDTACIAFDLVDLFGGPDCESTERVAETDFRPQVALGAQGLYLVGGSGGILVSTDGTAWTRALWSAPHAS